MDDSQKQSAPPELPSDFCRARPLAMDQLCAHDFPTAFALRSCLRGIGVIAQMGTTTETGAWVSVWVAPAQKARAQLVYRGFVAGMGVGP